MSELVYQEQSVSDLEYKLFKVKEFQQQLTILKQKSLTWQDYLVSFAIIGSSHLVEIELANQKLIEILACVDIEQDSNFLYNQELESNSSLVHSTLVENSIKYDFTLEIINFKRQDKYQNFNQSLQQEANDKLYYVFPGDEAVTSIEIFNSLRELKWVTYHSYAEEKQVVKTITSLTR